MPTEHEEQREFVKWMRQTHPEHRIFAIPNGGHRSKTTAAKLKAEGATKGIPDLFVPSLGLWIEMKRVKGGAVSPEQKEWINYLNGCGYSAVVCKGFEQAKLNVMQAIEAWNKERGR